MERSSRSDLFNSRPDSLRKGRIKQRSPGTLSRGTFERSSAKQHPLLSHCETERRMANCVMPHNVRTCQRPVHLVKMMVARPVVGIRSWDRSVALSRTYFDL